MFKSKIFLGWFIGMLLIWIILFNTFNSLQVLFENWYYPAIMVLGAFVAGLTPEGGGAVAFPFLSVFLNIDRVLARDFSLMIQSVGMTSASIYILSNKANNLRAYKPMLWFIPVCFGGFVLGMLTLQQLPVYIIQALFLSLITTFAIAYYRSDHRGHTDFLHAPGTTNRALLVLILILGGMCASLFGTGADIILYTLLVTRFRMKEKVATHLSIMIMASMSILGFLYRHFVDQNLSAYQIQTWLCAYPVVLFMAPFGAYILAKIHVDWMLKGIVALNIFQLLYFNINKPSSGKIIASLIFSAVLWWIFRTTLAKLSKQTRQQNADEKSALELNPC
ncbi:sulfite exporter TauE/SafE family protein [Phragmitibacter flavus]|uniref:Probable membrane transporter protein n=1 Tax=Phragmitibacter flavus TaxID=2576071 RepID=A0A5R8KJL9_9BACT|nr:sulfite exporter TauE/SafE family protein [Phragmitibacter flavus]TLD72450.1 sulfite exporter TauE/SafE family protein [Phragmitibacter flavus]